MNYLWGGMMVVGVVYAVLTGNLDAVTEQALVSANLWASCRFPGSASGR